MSDLKLESENREDRNIHFNKKKIVISYEKKRNFTISGEKQIDEIKNKSEHL